MPWYNQTRGGVEDWEGVKKFLEGVLTREKLDYLNHINPVWGMLLVHRYGLFGYLPVQQYKMAKLVGIDETEIWRAKEQALYILGYSKEFDQETVVDRADRKLAIFRERQRICWTASHVPSWWTERKRGIVEAIVRLGHDRSSEIIVRTDTSDNEFRRVLDALRNGSIRLGNPSETERQEFFQELLGRDRNGEVFESSKVIVTRQILFELAHGKSGRQVARDHRSYQLYIAALVREARVECLASDVEQADLIDLYEAMLAKRRGALTPRERVYLTSRVSGMREEEVAQALGIPARDQSPIELAFLGLIFDAQNRAHNNTLPFPVDLLLPPYTEEQEAFLRQMENTDWPREDPAAPYPLTQQQVSALESLTAASRLVGGVWVVEKPFSIAPHWLVTRLEKGSFIQRTEQTGVWVITDRPYQVAPKSVRRRYYPS